MKVYTVFVRVRCTHPNWQPNLVARYIDSQWAVEESAVERKRELENSFAAFGCLSNDDGATASIVEGSVADARLVEDKGDDDERDLVPSPPAPSQTPRGPIII